LNGEYKIVGGDWGVGISNFKNGMREGKQISYVPMNRESTVVKLASFYKNGKLDGNYTKHRYDGKLLEIGTYKENIPVGIEKQYSPKGDLIATINYSDGLAWLRKEYSDDMSLKKEIFYNKDACKERILLYEYYDKNRKIRCNYRGGGCWIEAIKKD